MMEYQGAFAYHHGENGEDQEGMSFSATGPQSHMREPPFPTPTSKGQMEYILFENIPNGVTMSDNGGGSSIQSLPNIPSPLSGPTPSILSQDHGQQHQPFRHHHHHHPTASSSTHRRYQGDSDNSRSRRERDEEDTFFDDRSLEQRIRRTLGNAPSSVPITPTKNTGKPLLGRFKSNNTNSSSGVKQSTKQKTPTSTATPTGGSWSGKAQSPLPSADKLQSHRSAMAIVKLKTDLRDAETNLKLKQDEYGKLQRRYDRLQEEHMTAHERAKVCDEKQRDAQKETEEIRYELHARKNEQQKVVAERNAMENEIQQLRLEVESLKGENQEMSDRIRSLLKEHRDDINTFNESSESRIVRLKKELGSALKEVEKLKSSLEMANTTNAEQAKQLEEETTKNQAEMSELSQKHKAEIEELNQALAAAKEAMVNAETAKEEANQQLEILKKGQQQLLDSKEADQMEVVRLRNVLKETSRLNDKAAASKNSTSAIEMNALKDVNVEQQQLIEELKAESQSRDQELDQMRREMDHMKADNQTHLGEIQRLGAALEEAQKAVSNPSIVPSPSPLAPAVGVRMQNHSSLQAHLDAAQPTATSAGDSIAERLVRIRDAAERASLVKEHQREIARLKAQQESKIKALHTRHEQSKEDALATARSKLNEKHKLENEALRGELEAKQATMEKRHRGEIERLQEEIKENAKASEQSLTAAMGKVNAGKQRIEREIAKKHQLQQELSQLEKKLVSEKQQLMNRHDDVLDLIQRDCIEAFERQRTSSPKTSKEISPRSVVEFDLSNPPSNTCGAQDSKPYGASPEGHKLEPSSHSKIDEELRETEALVQSLLFGASEG